MIEEKQILITKAQQDRINNDVRLWEAVARLTMLVYPDKCRLAEIKRREEK